ncbi:MAG TPA: transglycosylase domain-containing protein [Gaiellaceae bacterium]|nr:transglycosylase domain-containing protein [Gaiellaceae bacterium]
MRRRDDLRELILDSRRRKRLRASRARRRRRAGVTAGLIVLAVVALLVAGGIGSGVALSAGCSLSTLRPVQIGQNSFLYAADGSFLGSIPAERNRQPVPLARMGRWLPLATVAVEDRRFYQHGGIDYVAIARALLRDVSAGKIVQGGSTITQQLVRNLYVGHEKTFERKLKEACLAIKLSARWSKDRILQEYLNTVYYGDHAYGAEAAAQTFFSAHARSLNLRQAALIAGLPQAPSIYDPFHDPQAAIVRRNEVLRAMLAQRLITPAQFRWAASSASLALRPGSIYARIREPYFFSYVLNELERAYGSNTVREGGLRVYTTIVPRLQRAAEKAIRDTLDLKDDPAAAIVSVVPGTGAIRAMTAVVPGRRRNQFNLAAQSAREAGSTFKAFVLATAIEQGMDPDTTYYDSAPFTCTSSPWCAGDYRAGKPWQVSTYDHTYIGWTSVTRATLRSDNTVFAQLTLDAGPGNVWKTAERLGVHLTQKPVASIGLGPLAVSPLDMAAAYAAFASNGIYAQPTAIAKVVLPDGSVDRESGWGKPQAKRVLSPGVAWKVTDVLRQNALYGTGAGSGDGIHPNAGKTGTTEDHADAWFVGYTRDLSTAVWMGYPGGELPMLSVHGRAVAGATFPVPIWHLYMTAAERGRPARDFLVRKQPPAYRPFTHHDYGYVYAPPATTTTTTPLKVGPPLPVQVPKPGRPVPATPTPAPTRPLRVVPRAQ